jgi:co-chaperonin GroES (HSP10)
MTGLVIITVTDNFCQLFKKQDGTIYALGQAYFDTFNQYKKIKYRVGDRVGMMVDSAAKTVTFYVNQTAVYSN